MKIALLLLTLFFSGTRVFGQSALGKIIFSNRNIPNSSRQFAYSVPICWPTWNTGAGMLPGGVSLGLFTTSTETPIVTVSLRNDNLANARFLKTSQTLVDVPETVPGQRIVLIVRAWQGASFEIAKNNTNLHWGEWSFTTEPLGGIPPGGETEVPTPGMTGWGPETGEGLILEPLPPPPLGIIFPKNGSVFAAPATISVVSLMNYVGDEGTTNASVFSDATLLANRSYGISNPFTLTINQLAAGLYPLRTKTAAIGLGWGHAGQDPSPIFQTSSPIEISVVDPVDVVISAPEADGDQFSFSYTANVGLTYVIQNSSDSINWTSIATNTATGLVIRFSDTLSSFAAFYKVNRLP